MAHVLEGSVRKSGKRLRITTQLVRADTGAQVWSETYDRGVDDIFTVQDEIARNVVEKLKGTLLAGAPVAPRATSAEAHTLYLQAQFQVATDTSEGLTGAVEKYRRVIELDPAYAPAWAGLSKAYVRLLANGGNARDPNVELAREAAEKAIQLDPRQAHAYAALAFLSMMKLEWKTGVELLAKGREEDPGNVDVLYTSGVMAIATGDEAAAVEFFQRAVSVDPLRTISQRYFARTLLHAGRVREAETVARRVIDLDPGFSGAQYTLGLTLLAQNQPEQALQAFKAETSPSWRAAGLPLALHSLHRPAAEVEAAWRDLLAVSNGNDLQCAEANAWLGRTDEAFKWLRVALDRRDPGLVWLRRNPMLRSIEKDPRFAALLRDANLAP